MTRRCPYTAAADSVTVSNIVVFPKIKISNESTAQRGSFGHEVMFKAAVLAFCAGKPEIGH